MNKIRNVKEVTTDITEIQRTIRDYYKKLYANKMDNLEEMEKFLERYNSPKVNQEERENMNKPMRSTEIETVILKVPTNKTPGPDGFTGEFYQILREELTSIFLKLLQKFQRRNTPKLILWGHHYPDTKTKQRYHAKKKIEGQCHWWT